MNISSDSIKETSEFILWHSGITMAINKENNQESFFLYYKVFGRKCALNIGFNVKYWWGPEAADLNSLLLISIDVSRRETAWNVCVKPCFHCQYVCVQLQRARGWACSAPPWHPEVTTPVDACKSLTTQLTSTDKRLSDWICCAC